VHSLFPSLAVQVSSLQAHQGRIVASVYSMNLNCFGGCCQSAAAIYPILSYHTEPDHKGADVPVGLTPPITPTGLLQGSMRQHHEPTLYTHNKQ